MKNFFKLCAVAMAAGIFCFTPMTAVYAENSISTGTVDTVDDKANNDSATVAGAGSMPSSSTLFDKVSKSDTTIEELGGKVTNMATSTVDQIRSVASVICVGTFICAAILTVFCALSKKATIIPGVIGMIISVVVFGLIYNAPTIVAWGATLLE